MLGRFYKINNAIDDTEVNPLNINDWLNSNKGYTANGKLYWGKGIEYLGFINEITGEKMARFDFNTKADYNVTSTSARISEFFESGKLLVAYSKKFGHYFILDGKIKKGDGDQATTTYTIKDPVWYNTKILDEDQNSPKVLKIRDYNNYFDKANFFTYLETPKKIVSSINFYLASPAEFLIIDSQGRKLGKDPITNTEYNEIPDAIYTQEGPIISSDEPLELEAIHETKVISISTPIEGNYEIKVIGTAEGSYTFDSLIYNDQGDSYSQAFVGNTQINLIADYDLSFTSEQSENIVIQQADNIPPTTAISFSSALGNNNWHISDVQVSLSAEDNENGIGVFKTEYSLDNGQLWLDYTAPFIISQEGIHNILYRSYDFVGNIEQTKIQEIKIDKTPSEAKIYFDKDNKNLKIEGIDNLTSNPKITSAIQDVFLFDSESKILNLISMPKKIKKFRYRSFPGRVWKRKK